MQEGRMSNLPEKRSAVAPPMVLGKSLEQAPKRAFLHVDNKGRVRSPKRYRAIEGLNQVATAGVLVGAPVVLTVGLGPLGLLIGAGISGLVGWRMHWSRKLDRAVRLLVHDRTEEARMLLDQVRSSALLPRSARALAEQNMGACYARERDYEKALEHQLKSIALHKRGRKTLFGHVVDYAAIHSLVNLGRVKEARLRIDEKGAGDDKGDYLRLQHWVAELHVCMAEGEHSIAEDDLYGRAREALGITTAAALLGLLAWAHHHIGDEEQAWLLLHEAIDRQDGDIIERTMPLLGDWMTENADKAKALDAELEL
jgi:hypothetical protein